MNKFSKMLIIGLIIILAVSAAAFVWMDRRMDAETESDVEEVAAVYIEGIAAEELLHFRSLGEIRFNQINYILRGMEEFGNLDDVDSVYENLSFFGKLQELPTMALIDADGNYETVYGAELTVIDNPDFIREKLNSGLVATTGANNLDQQLILWCVPVAYPMRSGASSVGIICSRPMDLFIEKMNLNADGTLAYFHLIRLDGTYVIQNSDTRGDTFYEKLRNYATGVHQPIEEIIASFRQSIANQETCSWVVNYDDGVSENAGRRSTLAFPLPDSDWYIVAVLPYNSLGSMVAQMGTSRAKAMFIAVMVITLCILIIFALYFMQSQNQMKLLEAARQRADEALTEAEAANEGLIAAQARTEAALAEAEEAKEDAEEARERADRLSLRNEAAVQILHQTLHSGMWGMTFDSRGKMIGCQWSNEFRRMIGYTGVEDFPDRLESWSDLLHSEDKERVMKEFRDTINDYSGVKTYDVKYQMMTRDQGYRWFHACGRLSRRPDGTPKEYFGLFIDITDRVNAKRQLKEALTAAQAANEEARKAQEEAEYAREDAVAANKAKSEFLSNMSHDIRTPMNAIVGMTAIAKDHIDDKARVQDCLKKITLSGKQLLGLINDVLDMSKIESGKMTLNLEALSLKQTMETMCDIVRPQIKSNGQNFDILISNILSEEVYCDSVRINQVLLNFLSNAMKFTPEGGSIYLKLWQEESPKGDDHVRTHLAVQDTGMGMTEEFRKKLFSAFEREDNRRVHKTQGTGLGMAITKYIVDAMGGTIDVVSEVGVGTTFHVIVDFERVTVPASEMKLPDWKVLVVDDNEELCRTAALSLTELGTRAETCLSGEEAVERVAEAENSGEGYFAVLIDYKMDGMSGVETARAIREKVGGQVPISLISAYDWSDIEEEAKAAGITGFIPKPLFKSTLYHELRKFCCEAEQVDVLPEEKTVDLTGLKILLAEDNDINAEIASMILEESGCTVDHAEDGKIATEMFERSAEGCYDVILMDLRMPHMNGIEATEAIRVMKRSDAARVPIIAMTADAFAEDAQKCLAAGMNAHLAKPIDIDQLKNTLAKFTV